MPESAIEVVLFDLGGVLFDFGGVEPMKSLSGIEHDDEIWRRWLGCPWVRTFERGSCSADQFAEGVVGSIGGRPGPPITGGDTGLGWGCSACHRNWWSSSMAARPIV